MRLELNQFRGFSYKVSIHASVKDATKGVNYTPLKSGVSIHASVKDATKANALATRAIMVSIHASVKDATLLYPD